MIKPVGAKTAGNGNLRTRKLLKKKTISQLKKEAWTVFSKWVRNKDRGVCYTCKKSGLTGSNYHAGHFISRRHNAVMFNEVNVRGQCMFCNLWDYGNSGAFAAEIIKEHGQEVFENLIKQSRQVKQFTVGELEEIIKKYS